SALNVAAPGLLANDGDADGPALSAVLLTGPSNGTLTLNGDGSFSYTPGPAFAAADSFTYVASDGQGQSAPATVTLRVNHPPSCPAANIGSVGVWSPDKTFHALSVMGITDPDGDTVAIVITGIRQDERVRGQPDARILGPDSAEVRADRDGNGDGRVYHI